MGLLRKAAHAVPDAEAGGRSGLLKRSLRILSAAPSATASPAASSSRAATLEPPRATTTPSVRLPDLARFVIEDIKAQPDGVELPSLLFTSLRKRLSVAKGALLLYDPLRLEYAPWASFGYDQTTLHRLRIPLGANDTFNALANGSPIEVTQAEQKSTFQRFFSSREFPSIEKIVLSPYIFEDTLVGVLLATDIRHPFADSSQLLSCLSAVAAEAAPLLQKARGFLMKWSQARTARRPVTPEERIARLLESPSAQGKRFLFLSVALDDYIETIVSAHEDLDPFRLREDITSFLDAFLAYVGVAIQLPAGVLLVCLQEFPRSDIDLFSHQMRAFLALHFSSDAEVSSIKVAKSRAWPDEGSSVRELISFFS